MTQRFAHRVVVITGASSGVGAAAARMFADEGAKVVLAARRPEELDALAEELGGEGKALAVPTDVADPDACAALLEAASERFGAFHVLVNNAGFNQRGSLEGIDPARVAQMVDVNLRAPMLLSRLSLPYLRQAGGGAIVNVASVAGMVPLPHEATYSGTKFGLRAFTYALSEELRDSGVTASVVSPGPIDTPFIMDEMEHVPDLVFSQPMSTAEQIAELVVQSAADGKVERVRPQISGVLATTGYLHPWLPRLLRPMLEKKGRKAKAKFAKKYNKTE